MHLNLANSCYFEVLSIGVNIVDFANKIFIERERERVIALLKDYAKKRIDTNIGKHHIQSKPLFSGELTAKSCNS